MCWEISAPNFGRSQSCYFLGTFCLVTCPGSEMRTSEVSARIVWIHGAVSTVLRTLLHMLFYYSGKALAVFFPKRACLWPWVFLWLLDACAGFLRSWKSQFCSMILLLNVSLKTNSILSFPVCLLFCLSFFSMLCSSNVSKLASEKKKIIFHLLVSETHLFGTGTWRWSFYTWRLVI